MSDPFETLKHLGDGPAGPALPAAEVRRRGDRVRRRRTTLRALAAACAVAVITTGGIALGSDRPGSAPSPPVTSPTPTPTEEPTPDAPKPGEGGQALTIPDGFPLAEGFPNQDVDTDREVARALGTPRSFDPCHDNADAAVEAGRTDFRRVTQTGPAYGYSHELVVYESSSAAHEAMLLAKSELERCTEYAYDDGVSRDVWEPSPVSPDRAPADDGILAVSYGYGEYGPSTLATSWMVMRVGNAIFSLSHDGEFGASPESVRIVTRDELRSYLQVAPSLCPFADETTDIGCGAPTAGDSDTLGPDGIADLELGMQTGEEPAASLVRTVGSGDACQGFQLTALPPGRSAVDGYATAELGVVALFARGAMATPEGIAIGSSVHDLRTSYAHLVGSSPGVMTANASDEARYVFDLADDRVVGLRLELTQQSCTS